LAGGKKKKRAFSETDSAVISPTNPNGVLSSDGKKRDASAPQIGEQIAKKRLLADGDGQMPANLSRFFLSFPFVGSRELRGK